MAFPIFYYLHKLTIHENSSSFSLLRCTSHLRILKSSLSLRSEMAAWQIYLLHICTYINMECPIWTALEHQSQNSHVHLMLQRSQLTLENANLCLLMTLANCNSWTTERWLLRIFKILNCMIDNGKETDSTLGEGCNWCHLLCGVGGFFHQHIGVSTTSTGISAQPWNQVREK